MIPVKALVRMPWELADVSPQTPVLLALSGGADSRFLLHVLSKGAERDGFPILLAHVHHGIRGETADRDCEFCLSLAARYGLPIEVLRADVPTLAREHGRGLEEEARAVRYEFFGRLMRERGIHLLATAHQADDLLETMLFRMARGTGGGGLCAIPRVRKFGEGWLTRPLLELTAAEIRAACRKLQLDYIEDETNSDRTYARNRIRGDVIPALETLFPAPQKQAVRLSERLRADEDYFCGVVDEFFSSRSDGNLSCADLAALHPAVRSRVFARWLASVGVTADAVLLARLDNLLEGANGRRVPLSRDRFVTRCRDRLSVQTRSSEPPAYRVPLSLGEVTLPSGVTVSVSLDGKSTNVYNLSTESTLKFAAKPAMIEDGWFWRERRAGDAVLLGGHHRRLRRLWREAGVPAELRERLPVLCNADGAVVWAPYIGKLGK